MKITEKVEGGDVSLELTDAEQVAAFNACDRLGIKSIILMKKDNAMQMFTNPKNAANARDRNGFDFSMTVKKATLASGLKEAKERIAKSKKQ